MADFIISNFKGVKVTIAVTGLPVVICGEVLGSRCGNIIGIKAENGSIVNINADLIVFVL
ncbi:hypothetical protein ACUH7Y_01945 [Clostridium beijerinckii]|uniref:Uncharacterized protein n=1 Tax=Clostridium beijerinckii TaxID=1520 RepID=A0A1W7LNQ3_CLOBE|nr:hypothetical protein [Clostridium beijerinckii]MBA8937782.1 hypothetical protein [Clostridium beijerinckii]NMF07585.1 hypothetical protein [Clostridium beijerinckii]NOW07276.1 hypothetical protein [Clostridium beijerinckii]NRT32697.1 hypothetical protein [Clostridium beijerinckii]NRT47875.1 hypothetical protein [Clostridium beijerinckii]